MKFKMPTASRKRLEELPSYLPDCIDMSSTFAEKYIELTCSGCDLGNVIHHIVPVYFFKRVLGLKTVRQKATGNHKASLDMAPDNLSRLTKVQHLVAHYYLHKCSVPELKRSSDRAFMTMFNTIGQALLNDSENEYSHLYEDMLSDFNALIETYGSNFIIAHHKNKEDDDLSLATASGFPSIKYYITIKNPQRGRRCYFARILQDGKESAVYLYDSESLANIWLERVKRVYEIAVDYYLETGTVPDYIKDNLVTVYNLHDIYKQYLPVPVESPIPKMTYSITKRNKYGYSLVIGENGKRTRRFLHTDSLIIAKRMLARVKRVYDEAISISSRGLPIPEELNNLILRINSGNVEDYMKPGNIGLLNFMTGGHLETPSYRVFNKKSKKILFVIDEWEASMRSRGVTDRSIYRMTLVVRKNLDTSSTIDTLSEEMVRTAMNRIIGASNTWYKRLGVLRLFIKFAASRYSLPANLITMCEVSKSTQSASTDAA